MIRWEPIRYSGAVCHFMDLVTPKMEAEAPERVMDAILWEYDAVIRFYAHLGARKAPGGRVAFTEDKIEQVEALFKEAK